jgi:hypothetical protein
MIKINPSSIKNQEFNFKFSNKTKRDEFEEDFDLKEILNKEIEERRGLIQLIVSNVNRITLMSKTNF